MARTKAGRAPVRGAPKPKPQRPVREGELEMREITRDELRAVMTCDLLERKRGGSWREVGLAHIASLRPEPQRTEGNPVAERPIASDLASACTRWGRHPERLYPESDQEVLERISETFSEVGAILALAPHNLMVAGGAVVRVVMGGSPQHSSDLDFFFVGLDAARARQLMRSISRLLLKTGNVVMVMRGLRSTTFFLGHRKYQFVHRLWSSHMRVLGGFDLACCSIGVYEGRVVATQMGAWSIANVVLPVDLSRRSLSFNHRISKYARKMFRLLLPGQNCLSPRMGPLGISLHPAPRDVAAMRTSFFVGWGDWQDPTLGARFVQPSDYVGSHYGGWDEPPPDYAVHSNSYAGAIMGKLEGIIHRVQHPAVLSDVTTIPDAELSHDYFRKKFGPKSSWSLDKVGRVFGPERALAVLTAVYNKDPAAIDACITEACDSILEVWRRWHTLVDDFRDCWLSEDPSRQYSASFNPAIVDVREFYGSSYVPFNIGLSDDEYLIMRLIRKNYPMPGDVFNYLLETYLYARLAFE